MVLAGALLLSALPGCTSVSGQIPLEDALADRAEVRDLTQDMASAVAHLGLEPCGTRGPPGDVH